MLQRRRRVVTAAQRPDPGSDVDEGGAERRGADGSCSFGVRIRARLSLPIES